MKKIVYDNYEGVIELTVRFQTTRFEDEEDYWAADLTPVEILDSLLDEGYHQFEKDHVISATNTKAVSATKLRKK